MNKFLKNLTLIIKCLFIFAAVLIIVWGIFLRTQLYLNTFPLWQDEKMLAISVSDKNIFRLFMPLGYMQKAPPLFCILTSGIINIFKPVDNPLLWRIVPFICGIVSIFAFLFLLLKNLKSKIAILIGLMLFCANFSVIYYTNEYKPYSSDVLICVLLLSCFPFISFKNITNKKLMIYLISSIIIVLFSFPALFIITAFIPAKFIEEKYFSPKALWIFAGILAAEAFLFLSDIRMYNAMCEAWNFSDVSFLPNLLSCCNALNDFVHFFTFNWQESFLLIIALFFVLGLIKFYKEKNFISFTVIFLSVYLLISSVINVYPFSGRMILFLIPIVILLIVKPLDFINFDNKSIIYKIFGVILLSFLSIVILYIMNFFRPSGITKMPPENIIRLTASKENRISEKNISETLLKNYKENENIICISYFYFDYKSEFANINLRLHKKLDITSIDIYKTGMEQNLYDKVQENINQNKSFWVISQPRWDDNDYTFLRDNVEKLLKKNKVKYVKYEDDINYLYHCGIN